MPSVRPMAALKVSGGSYMYKKYGTGSCQSHTLLLVPTCVEVPRKC